MKTIHISEIKPLITVANVRDYWVDELAYLTDSDIQQMIDETLASWIGQSPEYISTIDKYIQLPPNAITSISKNLAGDPLAEYLSDLLERDEYDAIVFDNAYSYDDNQELAAAVQNKVRETVLDSIQVKSRDAVKEKYGSDPVLFPSEFNTVEQ